MRKIRKMFILYDIANSENEENINWPENIIFCTRKSRIMIKQKFI